MLLIAGCDNSRDSNKSGQLHKKKELLIYCGITMTQPMKEILALFEKSSGYKVLLVKGGSGNLLRSIKSNRSGDIYIPGAERYMKTAFDEGLVLPENTCLAGFNKVVMLVKKGNPLGISSEIKNLAKKKYRVVLGAPESGSVGSETEKILKKSNLSDAVYENVLYLTTDSKDLTEAIINDKCDIVVNWKATVFAGKNKSLVSVIDIDENIAVPRKIIAGVLKYSNDPDAAKAVVKLIGSEKGQAIFRKFGF
jgi:molybdate transport system substrate-binding protein